MHYNIKTAIMLLGDKNFSVHYNPMGLLLYMQFVIDAYVIISYMTV